MSDLLSSLTGAARALDAQQYGLATTGQNIANLNTDGYVRRTVLLAEVPPGSGGGVQVLGVQALRDPFIEARLRSEVAPQQRDGAIADSLAIVETSLGDAGTSIDQALTGFFDAFATLAQDPSSSVARQGVLLQGRQVAQGFNDVSSRLDDSQQAADAQVRGGVVEINALAATIASLNSAIGGANGVDVESLKDQQAVALKSLAGLTTTTVMPRGDGGADVAIGSGRALVVGGNSYTLGTTSIGPAGFAAVTLGGTDVTSELTDGRVGGLLHTRDALIPGYKAQLDQLAFSLSQQVNATHQSGFDLNGATGNVFFIPQAAAAGAASTLAIDPGLAADPSLIAASATGTVGDNQTAQAIAALRDARAAGGGSSTFTQAWSQIVHTVASDAQTAQANQQNRQDIVSTLERLRDSVSGVSLDEEAGMMLKFQRAYEANAKYFAAVNGALDTLMAMVK